MITDQRESFELVEIWDASGIWLSSLRKGDANLSIFTVLVYVLPEQVQPKETFA